MGYKRIPKFENPRWVSVIVIILGFAVRDIDSIPVQQQLYSNPLTGYGSIP